MFKRKFIRHDIANLAINSDFQELLFPNYISKYLGERNSNSEYVDNVKDCIGFINELNSKDDLIKDSSKIGELTFKTRISKTDAVEICTFIKQADEFINASQNLSILSKPILYYYAHLNLAKALIHSAIKFNSDRPLFHGLDSLSNNPLEASVKRNGCYILLLCCLGNKELLEESLSKTKLNPFSLENLINPVPTFIEKASSYSNPYYSSILNKIYVCSFIMSSIARYKPVKWRDINTTKPIDISSNISRFYLQSVDFAFKILIMSYFRGEFLGYAGHSYYG